MKKIFFWFFLVHSFLSFSLSADEYGYLFFYRQEDSLSQEREVTFDNTMTRLHNRAKGQKIDIQSPEAKSYIDQYDLRCVPIPFVLVVAPNGAITGCFAREWSEEELVNAIVTRAAEETLKALQANKLVFVVIRSERTMSDNEMLKGVEEFMRDSRFVNSSTIVHLDPSNPNEERFLKQLGISPSIQKTTLLFLAPPGDRVGLFEGTVTKEELVKSLECATSGCCGPGCCSGSCCPGK